MPSRQRKRKPIKYRLINQAQCHSKKVYYSEAFALEVAARRIKRSKKPLELRAYNCPNCLQWHLTSQVNSSKVLPIKVLAERIQQRPKPFKAIRKLFRSLDRGMLSLDELSFELNSMTEANLVKLGLTSG